VIESFRNDLFPEYKTGEGISPDLLAQFEPAERPRGRRIVVWPMVEFEADDALATEAARFATPPPGVEQVVICSPGQGSVAVRRRRQGPCCRDRRPRHGPGRGRVRRALRRAARAIPDWLALVGDSADGNPRRPGWGEKSASAALEDTEARGDPDDAAAWGRGGARARIASPPRSARTARRRPLPASRDASHRRAPRRGPRRPGMAGSAARPRRALPRGRLQELPRRRDARRGWVTPIRTEPSFRSPGLAEGWGTFPLDRRGGAAHLTGYQRAALAAGRPQRKARPGALRTAARRTPRRTPMEVGDTPPASKGPSPIA